MQIFLPDFFTVNPQTSKPVLTLKSRTSPVRKSVNTQRNKPRNHTTRTLQSSQTLRTKSLNVNNDKFAFKRNCFDISLTNQTTKIPMFPNQNNDLIHCRKTNHFRLYNSPRVKTTSKPTQHIKQQQPCAINSMTSPFLLTKSFNYQRKIPKLPKTADLKRNKNNITQIKYKNDQSYSFCKLGKLLNQQNSIYRPWSPTKNQFGQQQLK